MYIQNNLQKKLTVTTFLLPSILGMIIFSFIPIVISLYFSTLDYDILIPFNQAKFIGIDNFTKLLSKTELYSVLSHTLYYMILYIPLILISSLLMASLLNRDFKGSTFYKILFYIPVITSWVAGAVIWKWILNSKFGFLNQWLGFIGIPGPNWLFDKYWAMPGIVIAAIWKDTGYYALIFLAALKGVDKSYHEAAIIDGANKFQRLTRITLPLISPTMFLVIIMNVIGGFQVFESVYIMTGGGPANATTIIVERIYANAFRFLKMGYASAYAWVLFLIIFIITMIQLKLQKRWVNYDT